MELPQNVRESFEKFKKGFTCPKCKRLFDDASKFSATCEHVQCSTCWKTQEKCYVCKSPINGEDVTDNHFIRDVMKSFRNIEGIFRVPDDGSSKTELSRYDVSVPKLAMKRNHKGETPLHLACKKGDLDKVKELIREGVDFNMTDYANWTPLHEAVQGDRLDCVECLLKNGALASVPGENYVTPLHKAVSLGKTEMAQLLISYGADLNAVDYHGLKPLEIAIKNHPLALKADYDVTPKIFVSTETTVYARRISEPDKYNLTKAKVKLAARNEFSTKDEVTHYVSDGTFDSDILTCLLKGIFIVDQNWIVKYSSNPDKKSFRSIVAPYKKPNTTSVVNRMLKNPKLFDGMNFFVTGHSRPKRILKLNLDKEGIITLIRNGGGKILNRSPIVKETQNDRFFYPFHAADTSLVACDSFVIYHESEKPKLLYNMKELKHKSSEWLVECVLNYKIIEE